MRQVQALVPVSSDVRGDHHQAGAATELVELDLADLSEVSGAGPYGGWSAAEAPRGPYGGW